MPRSSKATKQRILASALVLLNERGVAHVTVRAVATRVGISHGNLCYHFPNMAHVVEALYDELVRKSDFRLAHFANRKLDIALLFELQSAAFDLMIEYRFLFLDYVAIFRSHRRLRRRLLALKERRKSAFLAFLDRLQAEGWIRRERFPGEYSALFQQYDLMSDFWISQALIGKHRGLRPAKRVYQRICFGVLVPFFTDRALTQYRKPPIS